MNNFSLGFISCLGLIGLIKLTHYVISDLIDINKNLESFYIKAMFEPKMDLICLKSELREFYKKRIYHIIHGNRIRNIITIIETRQRYEK